MNTERLMCGSKANPKLDLPNIIYIPASYDLETKQRFLSTCNACVHARADGETFGMAIAECSISGLPVITHSNSGASNHLYILGPHAIRYNDTFSLYRAMATFDPAAARDKADLYRSLYARFSPANVMLDFLSNFGILSEVTRVAVRA
jgi:glycosyltransferase involved in cell wall biosynthesis